MFFCKMEQIYFEDFPNELVELTLSFITSNKSKRLARSVCKRWMQYICYVPFDIYLPLPDEIQTIAETLSRCDQLFSLTVHKADKIPQEDYNKLFAKLTNMISLKISFVHRRYNESVGKIRLNKLTNLQKLSAEYITIETSANLPQLTFLEVAEAQISDWNHLPNLEFFSSAKTNNNLMAYPAVPNLTTLKYNKEKLPMNIKGFSETLKVLHIQHIKDFQSIAIPFQNLENLKITCSYNIPEDNKLTRLSINGVKTFGSIKSATTLQELEVGYISSIKETSFAILKNMKRLNALNIWFGDYDNFNGEFLNYLNPRTLTRLTAGFGTQCNNITSFVYLRDLTLWLEKKMNVSVLLKLTQLTSLCLNASTFEIDMQWINHMTSLQELNLLFKQESKTPLDLNKLTDLTHLNVQSLKALRPVPNLTRLRNLEFTVAEDYSFIAKLTKLTRLYCFRSMAANHVTSLHKIRELTLNFSSNDQLKALTGLQKLTYLIAASSFEGINVDTLTLLTRLQTVGFLPSTPVFGSSTHIVRPWTKEEADPGVAKKLPRLVYKPSSGF